MPTVLLYGTLLLRYLAQWFWDRNTSQIRVPYCTVEKQPHNLKDLSVMAWTSRLSLSDCKVARALLISC